MSSLSLPSPASSAQAVSSASASTHISTRANIAGRMRMARSPACSVCLHHVHLLICASAALPCWSLPGRQLFMLHGACLTAICTLHTAHCTLHTAYCISSSLSAALQCVHESRPKQSSPTARFAGTARLALGLLCAWQVIANLIHQRLGSIQRGKQGELCSMHPR